jgi:hypothetical protein
VDASACRRRGLDDLHVGARGDQERCQVVTEVMEAEPVGQTFDLGASGTEGVLQCPWVQLPATLARY